MDTGPRLLSAFFLFCLCLFLAAATEAMAGAPTQAAEPDPVEQATGLKKLTGARFIPDLKYAGTDNFLGKDVYTPFGLDACYVHPEAHERLMRLVPFLEKENMRLVLYDCYRPLEVQKAMWEILPDGRYVADPAKGSLHNRGVAVDCALADEGGTPLEFPTPFDSFSEQAWQSYACPAENPVPCRNREKLNALMRSAGFMTIRTEWWHFQLPGAKKYPLLPLEGDAR